MSYTRSYHEVVSGSKTVSVHYPASEHGGSKSVTVDIDIPVNIAIGVDTSDFDRSVAECAGGVNVLTGAVVAAGSAQVAAVTAGAHKVADTILNGFFQLIRSELTQQIAESSARCEALLLKLNDMKAACLARKSQMEKDYNRIADRYAALFHDLDRELANRVRAIDASPFTIREEATAHDGRALSSGASTVPTLWAGEDSQARTILGLRSLRGSALGLMEKAGAYLTADRLLNQGMRTILDNEDCGTARDCHVPVLYAEMDGVDGKDEQVLVTDASGIRALGVAAVRARLSQDFRKPMKWVAMDGDTELRIETFLKQRIAGRADEPGSYPARVGSMMMHLWKAQRPAVLRASANRN